MNFPRGVNGAHKASFDGQSVFAQRTDYAGWVNTADP